MPPLRLSSPSVMGRTDMPTMLSAIATLVATGEATTKTQLLNATGLARSTVSAYVDLLLKRSVLVANGYTPTDGRGRPAERLDLSSTAGVVLAVDLGARHARLALAQLNQCVIGETSTGLDIRMGPEKVIDWIVSTAEGFLSSPDCHGELTSIVIGIPARVDGPSGHAIRPNIMPGWDQFPITSALQQRLGSSVVLENDANLRAIGEAAALGSDQLPLVSIKVGTGVGAGIVDSFGNIFHGFDGSAGDIGHIPVRSTPEYPCTCGNIGCVEAVVSLPSMITNLRTTAPDLFTDTTDDVSRLFNLLREHHPHAVETVRNAAFALGEAVAMLCNTLNPRTVVVTGEITTATDELLAGVRGVAYKNARPLATRNLAIVHSILGERAGLAGAIKLGIEDALSPTSLAEMTRLRR